MRRKIIPYNPKLKPLALKLRKNMTLSVVLLWNEIKQKKMKGYDFDRQRPIDNFIVDFYCKDLMLAIKIDGSSHDTEEAHKKDAERQTKLETFGVKFLRFDDREVKFDMMNVLLEIERWIVDFEKKHPERLPGRIQSEEPREEPTPNPSQEGNKLEQKNI